MNQVHLIRSLFQNEGLQKTAVTPIKPAQMIYGTVKRFYPNQTALIQMGNLKVTAHVQADISEAAGYWFEVQPHQGDELYLKVIKGNESGSGQPDAASVLQHLQLPETKRNQQLIEFFLSKNLPLMKEQMREAASWMNSKTDFSKASAVMEFMIKNGLPFTKEVFQSFLAVQESQSFTSQLEQASEYLGNPKLASFQSIEPLKQMIGRILDNGDQLQPVPSAGEAKSMLKGLVESLGLEYEREIKIRLAGNLERPAESLDSLKPLLMSAMKELKSDGKALEPILHRLTGMQLISQDYNGPIQYILMQLPISFGGDSTDLTIQWSGKKTDKGQLDPNHCRIVFYLELKRIHDTVIDMLVQNKVIQVTIMNETKGMESAVAMFRPILKEKLKSIGYQLSGIKVIESYEKNNKESSQKNPVDFIQQFYQGVDLKV
ncbi:hypothetical protein [Neobacillus muris]|uniref:hypothetical protein n=1 Tax=Neobacillus muris TaxID=2941334 RepID=UPI00203D5FC5|nr:hypothetical protein [Neobacillus muris]